MADCSKFADRQRQKPQLLSPKLLCVRETARVGGGGGRRRRIDPVAGGKNGGYKGGIRAISLSRLSVVRPGADNPLHAAGTISLKNKRI